jgi:hypothetical protein
MEAATWGIPPPKPSLVNVNYYKECVNITPRLYLPAPKRLLHATPRFTSPAAPASTGQIQPSASASTPPRKQPRKLPTPYSPSELGKSARRAARRLATLAWHNFIRQCQHPTSLNPSIQYISHPAAAYLSRLAATVSRPTPTAHPGPYSKKMPHTIGDPIHPPPASIPLFSWRTSMTT